MNNKIVGLDGQPVEPEPKGPPVRKWRIQRRDGSALEVEGFFNVLGGFYPAIQREIGDDQVEIVALIHPEQLDSIECLNPTFFG